MNVFWAAWLAVLVVYVVVPGPVGLSPAGYGLLLTVMFRHYSGMPGATPTAELPGPFVAAMRATFAACLVLMALALAASLLRGGRRVQAASLH